MRNTFQRIIWTLAFFLVAGAPLTSAQFPQRGQRAKIKPIGQLAIVDSNGRIVGAALGGISNHSREIEGGSSLRIRSIVLLKVNQQVVPVAVGRDRFYGGGGLFFESENCQGNAWLIEETASSEPPPLLPRVAIGPPGQTIYVEAPGGTPQSITTMSGWSDALGCVNQIFAFDQVKVIPADPLVDLETEFTPPFSLKAAP